MNIEDKVPDDFELIEAYLMNKLSEQERATFETKMKADSDFQRQVENQQKLFVGLKNALFEDKIKQTLKRLVEEDKDFTRKSPKIYTIQWSKVAVWVAAASFILISYFSFSPISLPDSELDFYVTRDTDTVALSKEQKIAFEQFFEAQAHMAEGRYLLSCKNLETVLTVKDLRPYFRESAQWHLAISYLKSGQARKAEKLYQELENCTDCEYKVTTMTRLKIWWQIVWAKAFE